MNYQELSGNTWVDNWTFRATYKEFTVSRTGLAVTFATPGIYLLIEGIQRNNAGFTSNIDVYIVTYAGGTVTYNKIYTGQTAAYNVSASGSTLSFTGYSQALNLGVVAFSIL